MNASCALITTTNPTIVTKEFSLKDDGALNKKTIAYVTTGKMEIVVFKNLQEFSDRLKRLETNQCFTYGIPPHSPVELVTEKAWATAGYPNFTNRAHPEDDELACWSRDSNAGLRCT